MSDVPPESNVTNAAGRFRPLIIAASNDGTKVETVWDEARSIIAHYERTLGSNAQRILFVIDAPDLVGAHAGLKVRPSDAAGLCMAAAMMFLSNANITTDDGLRT